MAEVGWTAQARDDLRAIHAYVAEDSPAAADALVERIQAATDRLAHFPESGRVVPEFPRAGFREVIVGVYRVVYRRVREVVYVGAVIHGMRLLERPPTDR